MNNHVICGLLHRQRKEKKADKLSGNQGDATTERFLQFLSSSAWLCIFWIYIDSNKEERKRESVCDCVCERERERKWESPFINDTDNLIFQIILSLQHESFFFFFITITYEILFICWFILFRFWNLFNLDYKKYALCKIQPSLLTGGF